MSADDSDDLKDEFWRHVAEFEQAEPRSLFVVLSESGVSLPPPDQLDDSELTSRLWDVINGLAFLRTFLHNTNHLSDRQLYASLWEDLLREPTVLMPGNSAYAYHIDIVGSGSEEDTCLYLRYYADDKERQSWWEEWPEDVMPEHEDPPYDRDRWLPQAELRNDDPVM